MKYARLLVEIGIVALLIAVAYLVVGQQNNPQAESPVTSFDECQKAGYPVALSYPSTCRTPNGTTFTQDIGNEFEKQNVIKIANPRPNTTISSPLTITGEARGTWFFEASFPVRLVDNQGAEIATGIATAQGEWMTEDFVPFSATLTFSTAATIGTLILERDNPSGLPENADELRVPVKISQ